MSTPTYRLGLAMAGAVSAGAYSAGVTDCLFHLLETWEKKKNEGSSHIPDHRVEIEAISGASAGGIMGALVAFARHLEVPTISSSQKELNANHAPTGNIFYDTWVNLQDTPEKNTFDQLLETDDIDEEGFTSLLNSRVMDRIAEQVKTKTIQNWLPAGSELSRYMAPDLEMILTLCNLNGVPFRIEFQNKEAKGSRKPAYSMINHKLVAWFGYEGQPGQAVCPIGKDHLDAILDCAKGTSAFPIGLKARTVHGWTLHQLRESLDKLQGIDPKLAKNVFDGKSEPLSFDVVDGGTLNNEPFSELHRLLEVRKNRALKRGETVQDKPMIILIDPFPNFLVDSSEDSPVKVTLQSMVGKLLTTLMDQSRFKTEDLLEQHASDGFEPRMIFPSRHILITDQKRGERVIPLQNGSHIACGPLGGFAGFLSREFRVHDFLLGRLNGQMFFRNFCTLPCNPEDPASWPSIFNDWSPYMVMRYMAPSSNKSVYFLPVVPAFEYIQEVERRMVKKGISLVDPDHYINWYPGKKQLPDALWKEFDERKKYSGELAGEWHGQLQFPKISYREVLRLRGAIQKRIKSILLSLAGGKLADFKLVFLVFRFYPFLLLSVWRKLFPKKEENVEEKKAMEIEKEKFAPIKKLMNNWFVNALFILVFLFVLFAPCLLLAACGVHWGYALGGALLTAPLLVYMILHVLSRFLTRIVLKVTLNQLQHVDMIQWSQQG